MRTAGMLLAVVVLLSGCGPLTSTEVSNAGPEECPDVTEAWTVDLAADTPGAPTASEAIEELRDDEGLGLPLPRGEPDERILGDDRVRFVFTEDGRYTGEAMAIRLEGGWVVESAERCS
jgi:uncharacterized protein YceK